MTQTSRLTFSFVCLPFVLLACSDNPLSLGSNDGMQVLPASCPSGTVEGDVNATTQAQLDELSGCTVVHGSLTIKSTPGDGVSLLPLSSLQRVTGSLEVEGVDSLDGLQELEQAGNLKLSNIAEPDLSKLSSLSRVIWDPPGSGDGGVIDISDNVNLLSLRGLEQLSTWQRLFLSNNSQLSTLEGLSGPPGVIAVSLIRLPLLEEIGLGFLRDAESVNIDQTALRGLGDLPLIQLESLVITDNPALETLDGLSRLAKVGELSILNNPALLRVDLPQLEEVHAIRILSNAVLQEVPQYDTSSLQGLTIGVTPLIVLSEQVYEVSSNDQLTRIVLPESFRAVQQVAISNNPSLLSIDLNELAKADGLTISENAALARVVANSLDRVEDLDVFNNPALSTRPFAEVQTFTSEMRGNLDGPLTVLPGATPQPTP
jgi:hypothetical protein